MYIVPETHTNHLLPGLYHTKYSRIPQPSEEVNYNINNKAIRDGKYPAPPHASAWQRSPIKIVNFDIFFVT